MIEDIGSAAEAILDVFYKGASYAGKGISSAYESIKNIGSYFYTKPSSLEGKVINQIQSDPLEGFVTEISIPPYIPEATTILFGTYLEEIFETDDKFILFYPCALKQKKENGKSSPSFSLVSVGLDKQTRKLQNDSDISIVYVSQNCFISPTLLSDILSNPGFIISYAKAFEIFSQNGTIYMETKEEKEESIEMVWTFFKEDESIKVPIILTQDKEGGTTFIFPNPQVSL